MSWDHCPTPGLSAKCPARTSFVGVIGETLGRALCALFASILSFILTTRRAQRKNLVPSKGVSLCTAKLRLWLCLSSPEMEYFHVPNYPSPPPLFMIIPVTKNTNETASGYPDELSGTHVRVRVRIRK